MSNDPEKNQKLFDELFYRRISEETFLQEFGATREDIHSRINGMLENGLKNCLPEEVEEGIPLMYRFGITSDYLGVLNALALEPWHRKHEDIVFALGKIKDESCVEVLAKTAIALHPYLEVDEAFALGTKSIYALRNIRSPEAIGHLGNLARNENEILRTTARKLLKDLAKPRGNQEVESEARMQLEKLD